MSATGEWDKKHILLNRHLNHRCVMDFFARFFSTEGFMAHKHCYLIENETFWLVVVSDGLISLAYFSIPIPLFLITRKREDLLYKPLFLLFAAFILLCGMTHVMTMIGMWEPFYRIEGVLKLLTGLVSLATAVVLFIIYPRVLKIPSEALMDQTLEQLEEESEEKEKQMESNRMKSVETSLEPSAKDKSLTFQIEVDRDLPQFVVGDRHRVEQILINLVYNAIKFTFKGSVLLRVSPDFIEQSNKVGITFEVTDTGVGISEEDKKNIWEAFSQSRDAPPATQELGSGLGLSIVSELSKLMQGFLEMESEKGKGSTFRFHKQFSIHSPEG